MVALLNECGEGEKAKAFCERWHAILSAEADLDEKGALIGLGWAQIGGTLARIGENQKAETALRQARQWLDKARAAKFDPEKPHVCIEYAEHYAALAARVCAVFGADAAVESYEMAYQHATMAVPSKYQYYGFEKIVDALLEADDEAGAIRATDRVVQQRSFANCCRAITDYARSKGRTEIATAAARKATQTLDHEGFEPFMAHDMAKVAASVALAGETELAKRLFKRASGLSEANNDPRFDHPWIAKMQIRGGLLRDAYATIQSIKIPEDRMQSLAEFAREAARIEFQQARR